MTSPHSTGPGPGPAATVDRVDGSRLLEDEHAHRVSDPGTRRGVGRVGPAIRRLGVLPDLASSTAALALIAVSVLVGRQLLRSGVKLFIDAPPLTASWLPHVGVGTPFAIALALAAVAVSGRLSQRLPWRRLLVLGWLASLAWVTSLALVDGWQRGWVQRLTDQNEYLHDLPRIGGIGGFLSGFSSHILDFQPGRWTTHVSSHPPAATLVFLLADRAGLGGGAWAGALVIAVGSTAAIAVPVTMRALGAPQAARSVLPFTVFFPGAVWIGVSGDGLFTGVAAGAVAATALGVTGRRRFSPLLALAGGVLLGLTLYLSYGLALTGLVVAAVALCSVRRVSRVSLWLARWLLVALGVAAVVLLFSAAGFSWFRGLALLHTRYYQGIASVRPYSYFVWANLAALALSTGPVAAAGIARSIDRFARSARGRFALPTRRDRAGAAGHPEAVEMSGHVGADRPAGLTEWTLPAEPAGMTGVAQRTRVAWRAETLVPAALAVAALIAVLTADLTGLSKAETERIWLPFGIWLLAGLALLPRRAARWALASQVLTALLVNHLLLTHW